jgi:hypothetical protein
LSSFSRDKVNSRLFPGDQISPASIVHSAGSSRERSRNAEGLFISGDWVGPVGLLSDAAAVSGRSAGEAAAVFARH